MAVYKVTVCRLGYALVKADSDEEAKQLAGRLTEEEFCWYGPSNQGESLLVAYAELQDEES